MEGKAKLGENSARPVYEQVKKALGIREFEAKLERTDG